MYITSIFHNVTVHMKRTILKWWKVQNELHKKIFIHIHFQRLKSYCNICHLDDMFIHNTRSIKFYDGQDNHQCPNKRLVNSLGVLFHKFHHLFSIISFRISKLNITDYTHLYMHQTQSILLFLILVMDLLFINVEINNNSWFLYLKSQIQIYYAKVKLNLLTPIKIF